MAERRVRWGLLSTARINERLIPSMRESTRSELVAVASRSQATADQYAQKWGIPRAYRSYEAMLSDPEIDVVYISLPNGYHAEWAVKAADAGKHILCEKPLALTADEVDQMTTAARRNKVLMQEARQYSNARGIIYVGAREAPDQPYAIR
jgi:predicted dehydrogenase